MNRLFSLPSLTCLALLVVLLSPLSIATAQTDATTSATTSSSTPVITPPTPRPSEVRRATLPAIAQVRLTNLAANVSNRLDAYVRRITNVTTRLESRATKMAATGLEVTAAEEKITTAKAELDRARGALANIDVEVAAFVGSQNPRERWQSLRTSYTTAKEAIMAAHKATVEAVLLLKTAGTPAPTVTSTTTAEDVVQ